MTSGLRFDFEMDVGGIYDVVVYLLELSHNVNCSEASERGSESPDWMPSKDLCMCRKQARTLN